MLPPHCSNKLQPLDLSVFGPFKGAVSRAIEAWHVDNPLKTLTIYHMAGIIRGAYGRSFTYENITGGFQKAGIHPFNDEVYTENDFYVHFKEKYKDAEIVVDVLLSEKRKPCTQNSTPKPPNPLNGRASSQALDDGTLPSTSSSFVLPSSNSSGSPKQVTPNELFGSPALEIQRKEDQEGAKKGRRKGESTILTSTPEIEKRKAAELARKSRELEKKRKQEEREEKKVEKVRKQEEKKRMQAEKKKEKEEAKKVKQQNVKRKLDFIAKKRKASTRLSDESSSDEELAAVISYDNSDMESFSSLERENDPDDDSIYAGDFVLIRFEKEDDSVSLRPNVKARRTVHYVAKVPHEVNSTTGLALVSYLRKKTGYRFVFPDDKIKDEELVAKEDIVLKLPPPQNTGTTARQARHFFFPSLQGCDYYIQ
jgi:hypothetical protein